MSIVANKFPACEAALCHTADSARKSRMHNDANVLVLGQDVDQNTAKQMLKVWFETPFEGEGTRFGSIRYRLSRPKILRTSLNRYQFFPFSAKTSFPKQHAKKIKRPDWTDYFMDITRLVARRSTCIRRQVGAIVVKISGYWQQAITAFPRAFLTVRMLAVFVSRIKFPLDRGMSYAVAFMQNRIL